MIGARLASYMLAAAYGAAMSAAGVNWKHPAFWVGIVYGGLMALNEVARRP